MYPRGPIKHRNFNWDLRNAVPVALPRAGFRKQRGSRPPRTSRTMHGTHVPPPYNSLLDGARGEPARPLHGGHFGPSNGAAKRCVFSFREGGRRRRRINNKDEQARALQIPQELAAGGSLRH